MDKAKVIGRVAEIRLNKTRSREMTLRQKEDADRYILAFNGRGPGQFKMCVGATREGVQMHLQHEMRQHITLGAPQGILSCLEFRVNYNDIDRFGLTWEGFSIGGFDWIDL